MAAMRARTVDLEQTYTAQEFEMLPEFWESYELIEGRLVKKPMPGFEHNWIIRTIMTQYDRFDPQLKLGVMLSEASATIGPKDTPQPDISFWTTKTRPKKLIKGAGPRPDLAVEVLSPHDLETKKRRAEAQDKVKRYQAAGVRLIWLINPEDKTVEVYYPDQLEAVQRLNLNESLSGEDVIPGFSLPVKALFEYDVADEEDNSTETEQDNLKPLPD